MTLLSLLVTNHLSLVTVLSLSLFVPRVFAEDPHHAPASHDFALGTNGLDRRFHFHDFFDAPT